MGWSFGNHSVKENIIHELSRGSIDYSVKGNVLWILKNDSENIPRIFCILLQKNGGVYGYKIMDESMGPYYYDVPRKFLKIAPEVSSEWRDNVHKIYSESQKKIDFKKSLKIGDKLDLKNSDIPFVIIKETSPKLIGEYQGNLFRVLPKHF